MPTLLALGFRPFYLLAGGYAALGMAVVTNPSVPRRIRRTLNVESGLNDGIDNVRVVSQQMDDARRAELIVRGG